MKNEWISNEINEIVKRSLKMSWLTKICLFFQKSQYSHDPATPNKTIVRFKIWRGKIYFLDFTTTP